MATIKNRNFLSSEASSLPADGEEEQSLPYDGSNEAGFYDPFGNYVQNPSYDPIVSATPTGEPFDPPAGTPTFSVTGTGSMPYDPFLDGSPGGYQGGQSVYDPGTTDPNTGMPTFSATGTGQMPQGPSASQGEQPKTDPYTGMPVFTATGTGISDINPYPSPTGFTLSGPSAPASNQGPGMSLSYGGYNLNTNGPAQGNNFAPVNTPLPTTGAPQQGPTVNPTQSPSRPAAAPSNTTNITTNSSFGLQASPIATSLPGDSKPDFKPINLPTQGPRPTPGPPPPGAQQQPASIGGFAQRMAQSAGIPTSKKQLMQRWGLTPPAGQQQQPPFNWGVSPYDSGL